MLGIPFAVGVTEEQLVAEEEKRMKMQENESNVSPPSTF